MIWDSEELFFSGDDFLKHLIEKIDQAKVRVWTETYIYNSDELTRMLELHLLDAKSRGVDVRLLVDGIGSINWIDQWNKKLIEVGIQIRIFHPLSPKLETFFDWIFFSRLWSFFARINRRNHRKTWLIDDTAFVSSINLTSVHFAQFRQSRAWRDTGIMVTGGSGVATITKAFIATWKKSHTHLRQRLNLAARISERIQDRTFFQISSSFRTHPLVRLNSNLASKLKNRRDLNQRLRECQRQILISNPYFAPTPRFLSLLRKAARRGVDVQILVPAKSDIFFMNWVVTSFYSGLLQAKVRIFEYQPRFLHAKSMLIDSWATIGSSNLNSRSFRLDLELDLVVTKPENISRLREQFYLDVGQAKEIFAETRILYRVRFFIGRMVVWLFGHWI